MSDQNVPRLQTGPKCCTASTMLGAIATSFAFCFVLMVLFLYVRYLLIQRRRRRGGVPQEEEQKLGLDPAAIAQLPSFTYKRPSLNEGEDRSVGPSEETELSSPECSICLSSIEEGEQVRLLPNCRHMFHQECIDVWLTTNASCPVCRGDPEPRNSEHHELFAYRLQVDVVVEGVSSPVSAKDRSSGEIERVIPMRSEWRQLHGDRVVADLERQLC